MSLWGFEDLVFQLNQLQFVHRTMSKNHQMHIGSCWSPYCQNWLDVHSCWAYYTTFVCKYQVCSTCRLIYFFLGYHQWCRWSDHGNKLLLKCAHLGFSKPSSLSWCLNPTPKPRHSKCQWLFVAKNQIWQRLDFQGQVLHVRRKVLSEFSLTQMD